MTDDITPPPKKMLGRFTARDHEHRWHFLQARTEIEQTFYDELPEITYRKVEYAYFVCNDCPDANGEPNTIKRRVELRGEEDA